MNAIRDREIYFITDEYLEKQKEKILEKLKKLSQQNSDILDSEISRLARLEDINLKDVKQRENKLKEQQQLKETYNAIITEKSRQLNDLNIELNQHQRDLDDRKKNDITHIVDQAQRNIIVLQENIQKEQIKIREIECDNLAKELNAHKSLFENLGFSSIKEFFLFRKLVEQLKNHFLKLTNSHQK